MASGIGFACNTADPTEEDSEPRKRAKATLCLLPRYSEELLETTQRREFRPLVSHDSRNLAGQRSETGKKQSSSWCGESMLRSLRMGGCISIQARSGMLGQQASAINVSESAKFASEAIPPAFPSAFTHQLANISTAKKNIDVAVLDIKRP